jgi:hypothetical protein
LTAQIIAKYADDPAEKKALLEISEDRELYRRVIEAEQKTLVDIAIDYPSVKVSIAGAWLMRVDSACSLVGRAAAANNGAILLNLVVGIGACLQG